MLDYFKSTRHPWTALLFLTPLLLAYEIGATQLATAETGSLRNGADAWLRVQLQQMGVHFPYAAPLFVFGVLLMRNWLQWKDRPKHVFAAIFGTVLESALFAVLLWMLARNFHELMAQADLPFQQITSERVQSLALSQIVQYIGAGIYEEVLFRMGLFSLLCFLLKFSLLPNFITVPLAAITAAGVFAAAHHFVENGEPVVASVFLFRMMAGLIFTMLYNYRGFGVAVGAHAGYDILVGLSVG